MAILAIEFSTAHRSVAVLDPATGRSGLAEQTEGRATDAFGLIDAALERASVERADISRVAVGLGPGSYTGIRNAIAIAQGWEFGRGVQLAGFSSVACLAHGLSSEGWRGSFRIVVDAQRGEFHVADWRLAGAAPAEETPLRIVTREAALESLPESTVLVGPDAVRLNPEAETTHPSALVLARMAAAATDFVAGEALEPIYLRQISFVKAPRPRPIPPV